MELDSGEVLLILLVALLVYGGRLPEVARAVGKILAELKRGLTETKDAVRSELDPGVRVDLDAPREMRRMPAPEHLAKEDVSGQEPHAPDARPADTSGPQGS